MDIRRVLAYLSSYSRRFILVAAIVAAAPCPAQAEDSERTVLVLRVANEGKYNARFTNLVQDYLRKSAIPLLPSGGLTATQRKCNEPGCLTELAKDSLILTASVTVRDEDYYINASVYDAKSGRNRTAEDVCERTEIERRLKALTGRLVDEAKGNPTEAPAPAPQALRPVAAPVSSAVPKAASSAPAVVSIAPPRVPPKPPRPPLPTSRHVLAGILGATAVLSLGGAIGLTVQDHSVDCRTFFNLDSQCQTRATGLYAAAYGLAGTALLGVVLALRIPHRGGRR